MAFLLQSCWIGDQVDYSTPGPTSLVVENSSIRPIDCVLRFEGEEDAVRFKLDPGASGFGISSFGGPRIGRIASIETVEASGTSRLLRASQFEVDQHHRDLKATYNGDTIHLEYAR